MTATAEELVARLRRNPDDPAAYAALKAHYHQQNDFASLANLVEGWARRASDRESAARSFHEAAVLVEHYQSEHARAVMLFEQAIERDPDFHDAQRDLDHLVEAIGDPRLRIDSLERRIEIFTQARVEPQRIALLRFRLGDAWERGYHRADRALGQYLAALSLDPTLVPALYAARVAHQEAGNFVEAANLLEREASVEPDRDRALSLLRELGHLRSQHLDDLDGAVRAAEAAMALAPGALDVLRDLAYLLHARAAKHAGTPAADADAERAAAAYFQLAQSSRDGDALAMCEAALDLAPALEPALDLLEFLAHDLGREDVLAVRWVGYLRSAPDSPAARRRRHALAAAYVGAGQTEDAMYCLEPLLELGDAQAAEALADLYAQLGRHDDASKALGVAMRALPPEVRHERIRATIDELDAAGRRDEAVRWANELLADDPADEHARDFLFRALEEAHDDRGRLELALRLAQDERVPVEARVALYRQAAGVAKGARDRDAAFEAHRALLDLEPGAADALSELRTHLVAEERWDELAAILERSALTLTEPGEKLALLSELAELHRERRGDAAEAIRVLRAARELAPADRDVRDRLCDLLVAAGPGADAIPLLHERLAEGPEKEHRLRLQHALADALEAGLGDLDGAYLVTQRIVESDPRDARALERMERIDVTLGHPHRLLDTLGRRSAVASREERPALFVRMAEVAARELGEADRAASLYRKALADDPLDPRARDGLRALLAATERHDELAALLEELAGTESDLERRRGMLRELARVVAGPLGDRDRAAGAYERLLAEQDDPEAVAALLDHADRHGDFARWAELAERRSAHLGDTEAAQALRIERADVLVGKLEREREGAAALAEALSRAPTDIAVLTRLAAVYSKLEEHAPLAEVLESHAALLEDDAEKAPLEAQLAALYAGPLDNPEAAIRSGRDWASHAPEEPAPLRFLAGLFEKTAQPAELLETLDALVGLDPPRGREHVVRAARICAEQLADVDTGFGRLAARLEDGDDGILPALRAYALEFGRARAFAELVDRHAASEADPARAFALSDAAATVWLEQVGEPRAAMASALRALAVRPADEPTLERIEGLAVLTDDFDGLVEAYRCVLGAGLDDEAQVATIVRLADVLEMRARQPGRALEAVGSACARSPNDGALFERAEALAAASKRFDVLLGIHERRASAAENEIRLTSLLRCAEIACEHVGELDRGLAHLGRAAALAATRPNDLARVESTAARLDAVLGRSAGDPCRERLAAFYGSLAERPGIGKARTMLLLRAARLLAASLSRPEQAYDLLARAAGADPSDDRILEELYVVARDAGYLPRLADDLGRLVTQTMDAGIAARLAARRGVLLRDWLDRPSDAADAFRTMTTLAPADRVARLALRHALHAAGRFEDLVMTVEKELRAKDLIDQGERHALRRIIAMTWEGPLHNRWEALDAWKAVLREVPGDEEAREAIARLEGGGALRSDEPPVPECPAMVFDAGGPHSADDVAIGAAPAEEEVLSLDSLADVLVDDLADDLADDDVPGSDLWPEDDLEEATIADAIEVPPREVPPRRKPTVPPPPPPEAVRRSTRPPPPGAAPSGPPPAPASDRAPTQPPAPAASPTESGLETLMDIADFVDELDESASRENELEEPSGEQPASDGAPPRVREREPEPT